MERGNWKSAFYYLNIDLEITTGIGNSFQIAECYNNMGLLFSKRGMFERAIEFYRTGLEAFKESEDLEKKVIIFNNIGDLLIKTGHWEEANNNLKNSLSISSNLKVSQYAKLNLYLTIGNLLTLERKYKKAKICFNQSRDIIRKIEPNPRKIDYFNKIGKLYLNCYNTNENEEYLEYALINLEAALKINEKYNIPLSKGISLRYVGIAQLKSKEIDKAINSLNNSITIFSEIASHYEELISTIELAKLFFNIEKNEKAITIVKSCLFDSIQFDYKILQIRSYILLGDFSRIFSYYLNALEISTFDPIIYKRTCYLILGRLKEEDNAEIKIKLLISIKNINQDKYFGKFLSLLIAKLKGEDIAISDDELPTSLREELQVFTN